MMKWWHFISKTSFSLWHRDVLQKPFFGQYPATKLKTLSSEVLLLKILCQRRCIFSVHAEVEAKGESDRLSEEQLSATVNKAELVKITDKHRPSGTWAFWYPESEMDKIELETGQDVRLKTRGDGPFICESVLSLLLRCFHSYQWKQCLFSVQNVL